MHEVAGIVNVITAECLHNQGIVGIHASNKQSEYIPTYFEADLCARVHTYELTMHTSAAANGLCAERSVRSLELQLTRRSMEKHCLSSSYNRSSRLTALFRGERSILR